MSTQKAMNEIKIIINEVPLSKNVYMNMHWAKRKEYKEAINWLIYEKALKYGGDPYKKATVTFNIYFKTKRRRDVQNYIGGGLIAWLDALVDRQIIADDCCECIGQPLVTFNIDKANPRTEITIKGAGKLEYLQCPEGFTERVMKKIKI